MKKVLVLLLALSFVGVNAFAAAPAFAPVISMDGSATVSFGVDLDTEGTGIKNETDTNITLQLVTKDSNEKGGKEGEVVYGWIKLKDFEVKIDDDDGTVVKVDGVDAKLFLGPVYINILGDGAGTGKTVVAGALLDVDGNATLDVLGLTPTAMAASVDYTGTDKGIVVGLVDTAVVDVQVGVGSKSIWTTNVDNIYQFWTAVALKAVPNLTAEVKAGIDTDVKVPGVGVKVGYKVVIAEGYAVTPMAAADFKFDTDLAYRLSAGVVLGLPGATKGDWDKFTKLPSGKKSDVNAGLGVQFAIDNAKALGATDDNMDLTVSFSDGDLIPVLDVIAIGEIFGLGLDTQAIGIGAYASADLGMIAPFAAVESTSVIGADALYVQAGVDIKVITNTTFTLGYESGDLTGNTAGSELGVIKFSTKIAY